MLDINQSYEILKVPESASNEVVANSFKKLAIKYHPDKNRNNIEWANEAMTRLNIAYSKIMSHRFKTEGPVKKTVREKETTPKKKKHQGPATDYYADLKIDRELLINSFVKHRDSAKDSIYRFFQFGIYNLHKRDSASNRGIYNKMVFSLRKSYHSINKLSTETDDRELLDHFSIFNNMIFNFYRASECLNLIDSYRSQYDVEAYRLYKMGDEKLHAAQKEIFFERHNRGFFKSDHAVVNLIKSEKLFNQVLKSYPKSSWSVETKIKLSFTDSLKKYLELFFSEE